MTRTAVATDAPDNGDWLSTTDAARWLGVTPRTLYALIDEEFLPAARFGRVIRLRRERVERFAELTDMGPRTK